MAVLSFQKDYQTQTSLGFHIGSIAVIAEDYLMQNRFFTDGHLDNNAVKIILPVFWWISHISFRTQWREEFFELWFNFITFISIIRVNTAEGP